MFIAYRLNNKIEVKEYNDILQFLNETDTSNLSSQILASDDNFSDNDLDITDFSKSKKSILEYIGQKHPFSEFYLHEITRYFEKLSKISANIYFDCDSCDGTGFLTGTTIDCPECNGEDEECYRCSGEGEIDDPVCECCDGEGTIWATR